MGTRAWTPSSSLGHPDGPTLGVARFVVRRRVLPSCNDPVSPCYGSVNSHRGATVSAKATAIAATDNAGPSGCRTMLPATGIPRWGSPPRPRPCSDGSARGSPARCRRWRPSRRRARHASPGRDGRRRGSRAGCRPPGHPALERVAATPVREEVEDPVQPWSGGDAGRSVPRACRRYHPRLARRLLLPSRLSPFSITTRLW
jgi:hypothetical protein